MYPDTLAAGPTPPPPSARSRARGGLGGGQMLAVARRGVHQSEEGEKDTRCPATGLAEEGWMGSQREGEGGGGERISLFRSGSEAYITRAPRGVID